MTKQQKTGLIVGTIVVAIVGIIASLYYSRAFWVWRIKRKWGERFPFLMGQDATVDGMLFTGVTPSMWDTYNLPTLRNWYAVGSPLWFAEGTPEHTAAVEGAKAVPVKRQKNPS